MKRKIDITIDLKVQEYSNLKIKQFDDTQIIFKVIDDGISFSLNNLEASLIFEKPDNTVVYQECEINENTVCANLLIDCVRQSGAGKIELQLSENDEIISSFQIPVIIEKSAKENIESSNTPNYIELLEDAIIAEKERQKNEKTRKNNELEREENEAERITSEESRENNEAERVTAEITRESNETDRAAAEATREENEEDRTTAEQLREEAENARKQSYAEIKNYVDNNAIITHKYQMILDTIYNAGSNITIPCYYKVGAEVLDVFYCGSKSVKGIDYNEIGENGSVSNIIQFLDSIGDLDMSDVEGFEDFSETLEFIVRGEYSAS